MHVISQIKFAISAILVIPHVAFVAAASYQHPIFRDIEVWSVHMLRERGDTKTKLVYAALRLLVDRREFRSLLYYRIKFTRLFRFLAPGEATLFIETEKIGPGFFVQHGFATIIAAESIGSNFWVNQQVTIGFSNGTDAPIIGDNVTINAGAKVIGGVRIGSNSRVGANSVVVKDVPDNCTVVGVPGRIVRRDGARVDETL